MAQLSDIEIHLSKVVDVILLYHRETSIDMHVNRDPAVRESLYHKAEAAREMMMLLGKTLLSPKENKIYAGIIQDRLGAAYDSVFFDPATRKLIKQAKEQRNGGG